MVIDLATSNGLILITFPPHCSHRLQPLDISIYGPLKSYYKTALNECNISNPGKRATMYDLPACFTIEFYKSMSYRNITSGFKKSGIMPINSQIFSDDAFLPASIFIASTTPISITATPSV